MTPHSQINNYVSMPTICNGFTQQNNIIKTTIICK
nr:MAG TPA: hypothetical protein [Caudoviricetes sp.]